MTRRLILLGIVISAGPAAAQNASAPDSIIAVGTRHVIRSTVLGEARPYWVSQPPAGQRDLPVIVVLDGDAHFQHTIGTTNFLATQGRMPAALVVAVPNTGERLRDLSPATRDTAIPPSAGGADRMLAFLADELLPHIDRAYPTSRYRVLIGHSLGGLFAYNAWLTRPDVFQSYIAISPSLWWDRSRLIDSLSARLAAGRTPRSMFFTTMGGLEDPTQMIGSFRQAERTAAARAGSARYMQFELLASDDHGSTPLRSTLDGLEAVFRRWRLPPAESLAVLGVDGLDRRYRDVSAEYAMPAQPPEVALNALGYVLLQDSLRRAEAVVPFRENIRRFPRSANTYDSMGDGLLALGRREAALTCFAASVFTARSYPAEGSAPVNRDVIDASRTKMNQVARDLHRAAWEDAAIPASVVAECARAT